MLGCLLVRLKLPAPLFLHLSADLLVLCLKFRIIFAQLLEVPLDFRVVIDAPTVPLEEYDE